MATARHCESVQGRRGNQPYRDSLLVDCHARTMCSLAMTIGILLENPQFCHSEPALQVKNLISRDSVEMFRYTQHDKMAHDTITPPSQKQYLMNHQWVQTQHGVFERNHLSLV